MFTTFLYTVKVLVRDRNVLMWAVAFPLILATLFYSMFNNLDTTYELDPLPVIIVQDSNYDQAPGFSPLINDLAGTDSPAGTDGTAGTDSTAGTNGANSGENSTAGQALLAPTFVADPEAAQAALAAGDYLGYIVVDDQGRPNYYMDSRRASSIDTLAAVKQSIILNALDRYLQDSQLLAGLAQTDPQLLSDASTLSTLSAQPGLVQRGAITANPPSDALRYFYAVLAFSCIMMMSFGLSAIDFWKANVSALGARRSLGGRSWAWSLAPTLLAAWLLSLICVIIGFLYIRYVFGISFGGKEPACLAVLALSTLVATLLGAVLGAMPFPGGGKAGITAVIACVLSVFAGLYGPASQQLGDYVANNLPALSTINPVRQIYDAFFSLYYYDGYERFAQVILTLAVMAAIFFVLAVLLMRKQRYKSL